MKEYVHEQLKRTFFFSHGGNKDSGVTKLKCQMDPEDFLSQVSNHKNYEGLYLVQTLPKAERVHRNNYFLPEQLTVD